MDIAVSGQISRMLVSLYQIVYYLKQFTRLHISKIIRYETVKTLNSENLSLCVLNFMYFSTYLNFVMQLLCFVGHEKFHLDLIYWMEYLMM